MSKVKSARKEYLEKLCDVIPYLDEESYVYVAKALIDCGLEVPDYIFELDDMFTLEDSIKSFVKILWKNKSIPSKSLKSLLEELETADDEGSSSDESCDESSCDEEDN
jgi:hypothetical protein